MIEVGRHQGLTIQGRLCPLCRNSVENEAHFLFSCPIYQYQRDLFLNPIIIKHANFSNWTVAQKIELIMSNTNYNAANYIAQSLEIREFLINKPKRSW